MSKKDVSKKPTKTISNKKNPAETPPAPAPAPSPKYGKTFLGESELFQAMAQYLIKNYGFQIENSKFIFTPAIDESKKLHGFDVNILPLEPKKDV